jgi:hypothetical protein
MSAGRSFSWRYASVEVCPKAMLKQNQAPAILDTQPPGPV